MTNAVKIIATPLEPTGPQILFGIHALEANQGNGSGPIVKTVYQAMVSNSPAKDRLAEQAAEIEHLKQEQARNGAWGLVTKAIVAEQFIKNISRK